MKIDIKFDDHDLQSMLAGLINMGQDLTPLMDDIGAHVEMTTKERFDTGIAPNGIPWKPSYRAQNEGGKTLLDTGHFRDSITRDTARNEVTVGTNIIYAAIHQFGGVIRPKNAKKLAFKTPFGMAFLDQVTIPARPVFGLSAEDNQVIPEIVIDHYEEAIHGR